MLKKLTYLIAVLAITHSGFSQPGETEEVSYVNEDTEYVSSFDSLDTKDKIHYGFEMGASFTNSNRYGDYFSTYYRPTISYDISPRFSLNTGLTYINSHVNNVPVVSEYNYQLFSGNISQYNAFIGGEYKLTDRLIVGGSVFYDFTSYQSFDGQPVIKRNGLENIGYSGYFKYKVNDNFSIEGEIRINDRNPYNQNNRRFSNRSFGVGGSFFGR